MSLNLAELLEQSARACPEKTALICEEVRLTYKELAVYAKRTANALKDKGIGPGDRVAFMLPNVPQFLIVYYGILYTGATAVPLNPLLREREIAQRLKDCQARALFIWNDLAEEGFKAFDESGGCGHLVVVETGLAPEPRLRGESFVELLAASSGRFDLVQTRPDDTAAMIYTSGAPGMLSGAELTHFNLWQNAITVHDRVLHYGPEDVCLTALPLFHAFGQTIMMNVPMASGSTLVLMPRFDPAKAIEAVSKFKVTLVGVVPTMAQMMLSAKNAQDADFSSVRTMLCGGSKLPVWVIDAVRERFGIEMVEGYGLTETSPVVSVNPLVESKRPGSVGQAIWGVRVAILRPDGSHAAPKEVGEVAVRGHNVMRCYHKQPEITQRVMDGGWFHTGDLGYLDEDEYLYLTGLKKDLVICSGMNVFPWEVEEALSGHPAVAEVAVIGIPDELRGESLKAFIVIAPGRKFASKKFATYCREHLAPYKCPRVFEAVEALPRDPQGRVDKSKLPRT